ncbi:MAG: sulfotransferase, partial [Planctomycetia bacterium]|nr:sulfotransferase [Planctomycetia bacterium]
PPNARQARCHSGLDSAECTTLRSLSRFLKLCQKVSYKQQDWHGALQAHQQAVQLKPTLAAAQTKLGQTLNELGEHAQAIDCWREALRHDPDQVDALVGLASELGGQLPIEDLQAAESLLSERDDDQPERASFRFGTDKVPEPDASAVRLIEVRTVELTPPRSPRRMPLHGQLSESSRCKLHFALAQVRDARQELDLAIQHANEANRLRLKLWRQQGLEYDPLAHERFVDQVIEVFDQDYFDRVRGWGLASELPTFVVGLPRAGKSLVEALLTAHPQVFGADELTYSFEAFDALPELMHANESPLDCVSRWDRETVQKVAARYLERLRLLDADASRIVDTLPYNYLLIGFLKTLFPQARIVHCRRDLRDVALACWMKNFQHVRWASDWEHLVSRMKAHQRLMEHWRRVLPGTFLEVDYEETVADWESVARRLIEFAGLDELPRETLVEQFTQPIGTKRRKRPYQGQQHTWSITGRIVAKTIRPASFLETGCRFRFAGQLLVHQPLSRNALHHLAESSGITPGSFVEQISLFGTVPREDASRRLKRKSRQASASRVTRSFPCRSCELHRERTRWHGQPCRERTLNPSLRRTSARQCRPLSRL